MSFWVYREIGEVCGVGDGAHSKVQRTNDGVLYLTSKNIQNGTLKLDDVSFISVGDYEKLFSIKSKAIRRPQTGDLLLGIIGTFGNVYLYTDQDYFGISSSIAVIRPDQNDLSSDFLKYYIQSREFQFYQEAYGGGSVQGYINIPTIKCLPLPLPPLQEQKAIASVLSSFDDKIELLRKQNQTLEKIAQTLFKHWFVDFNFPDENGHPYKDSGGKMIPSELGAIPEGWEVGSIDQISSKVTKGTTPTTLGKQFVLSGVRFLKAESICDVSGSLDLKPTFIDKETHETMKRSQLKEGDLLISIAGTIGRMAVVSREIIPANINQALALVRPGTTRISSNFLRLYLCQPQVRNNLFSNTVEAVQANLSLTSIKELAMVIPAISCDLYLKQLDGFQDKVHSNLKQIKELQKSRDLLLPKLIAGEIRVSNIEAEMEAV